MHAHRPEAAFTIAEARAVEAAVHDLRMELIDGVIYSMGRASPWHAAITAVLSGMVGRQLADGPCRVFAESLAVAVRGDDPSYLHPDLTVIFGALHPYPEDPTVVVNPCAVFEVLSPGTSLLDRNEKLQKYKSCVTVDAIVHVDHTQRQIVAWLRGDKGWLLVERGSGQQLELSSIGVEVDVDALYDVARDLDGP